MDLTDVIQRHAGVCEPHVDNPRWCDTHESYWPREQHGCNDFVDLEDLVERVVADARLTE